MVLVLWLQFLQIRSKFSTDLTTFVVMTPAVCNCIMCLCVILISVVLVVVLIEVIFNRFSSDGSCRAGERHPVRGSNQDGVS